jgi:hypothetical protein
MRNSFVFSCTVLLILSAAPSAYAEFEAPYADSGTELYDGNPGGTITPVPRRNEKQHLCIRFCRDIGNSEAEECRKKFPDAPDDCIDKAVKRYKLCVEDCEKDFPS